VRRPSDEVEDEEEYAEEEDEDLDALIEELESQDGDNADYDEEEEIDQPGGARIIPEDLLQTDTRMGLNSAEVMARRKKYGYNQMKGVEFPSR
jgi:H+-transporting ATPase